ncbi:MAG TPA: DUF4215 domain-containing protein [Myxococcota bacterium]|nr:DUF4215 domain-containing protein [Myxococcota bacterium]
MSSPVRSRGYVLRGTVALLAAALAAGGAGCNCDCSRHGTGDEAAIPLPESGTDAAMGGGSDADAASDAASDAGPSGCGDGVIVAPEQCDDGNSNDDDGCLSDCTLACGDGTVNGMETCDVAIASGSPGACPTTCDDGDVCTTDTLDGAGCGMTCRSTPTATMSGGTIMGMFVDGDGCCPSFGNANVDSDCMPLCGNGVLEAGEGCETGTCPTSCDDGNTCTADSMGGSPATCDASCSNSTITACVDGDGCCPAACCAAGAAGCLAPDNDCSLTCGDGTLDPGETCDPPSACPASCDDSDACTTDTPTGSASNCSAGCAHNRVTMNADGDGCCPAGADANGDADCPPVCGNGAVEAGEECDDGNTTAGDGCDGGCGGEVTVFRLTDLDLRDPHIYVDIPLLGCNDVTDMVPAMLAPAINESIQAAMGMDYDGDGFIDVSVLLMFTPLDQGGPGGPMEVARGLCTLPASGTSCGLDSSLMPQPTLYTNGTGTCADVYPGTATALAGGYTPAVGPTTGPCFVTGAISLALDFQGTMVPLSDAQVAATYGGGTPATFFVNGLVRGFIAEATADMLLLPPEVPYVGGMPLSVVLPGGMGNCALHDDRDVGPDGLTLGWWVYANFVAEQITYTGP